jgi:hypothetical protein
VFDYSLKAGDTYETYSQEEGKTVAYKVVSVGNYAEGPKVYSHDYDGVADSTMTQQRYLRTWTVCRTDDNTFKKTWIEGVGSTEGPLDNLYDAHPISVRSFLAYVAGNGNGGLYLPFTFNDTMNRQVHGCNLPTRTAASEEGTRHRLSYELEGDRLHVYGEVYSQCGPNHYAYFTEEPTDDPLVHKLHFTIQEVEPQADCMALRSTNFYVPGFDPNMDYIVTDNQGEEHHVVNRTPQTAYRPMIEHGKVWKVGFAGTGNPVQATACYYFDGDTIIDGRICKQMMSQTRFAPTYKDNDGTEQQSSCTYAGAWYEEDQKVYKYDTTDKKFVLMYDFSLDANDTLTINHEAYVVGEKQTGGLKGFKGVYRKVFMTDNHGAGYSPVWMEGVGSIDGPTENVRTGAADPLVFLMSCTVGDEVIYLDDSYEDGTVIEPLGARKHRFDFSHTIKTQPKARLGRTSEQPLSGDYNDVALGINLAPLDDVYMVRISSESGKVVYEKVVNAGSIVALDIDISAYTKGSYTVLIENSRECFTGEFEAKTTGIVEIYTERTAADGHIYNLQGQRTDSLRKGLNIVNGRKVLIK